MWLPLPLYFAARCHFLVCQKFPSRAHMISCGQSQSISCQNQNTWTRGWIWFICCCLHVFLAGEKSDVFSHCFCFRPLKINRYQCAAIELIKSNGNGWYINEKEGKTNKQTKHIADAITNSILFLCFIKLNANSKYSIKSASNSQHRKKRIWRSSTSIFRKAETLRSLF